MHVYPAILSQHLSEVEAQLELCIQTPAVETVQLDIIDGVFADNLTVFPADLIGLDFGSLQLDFHLMAQDPVDIVRELAEIGSELPIRAVLAQVERMGSQLEYVSLVKRNNWKIGLSLDIFTPLTAVDPEIWQELDCIQLMAIESGTQGQKLKPYIFDKLHTLSELREKEDLVFEVIVDGGVKLDAVTALADHGADAVVVGSGLWQSAEDFALAYERFSE